MSELQETIQRFLEHSPPFNPAWKQAPDLIGWNVLGEFVCAKCASRIMHRGCWNWRSSECKALWSDVDQPHSCIGCGACIDVCPTECLQLQVEPTLTTWYVPKPIL